MQQLPAAFMRMPDMSEVAVEVPQPAAGPVAYQPVASYIHTLIVILIVGAVGAVSAMGAKQFQTVRGPLITYLPSLIWLWLLFGLVVLGIKLRHGSVREVIGGTWRSFDDALLDVVTAAAFWLVALLALAGMAWLLSHVQKINVQDATRELRGLAPHGALGISIWVLLSMSAGFVEEFVFRGYLQRQLTALTRSAIFGVLISAAIFSLGHLYQGVAKAMIIGVYGAMFGTLAVMRKSLRPGMFAHAWHDIFSGIVLSLLSSQAVK
jgi:membrane protease YdiL (CAAX protease family)